MVCHLNKFPILGSLEGPLEDLDGIDPHPDAAVEVGDDQPAEVGEVGDITPAPKDLAVELDEGVDDHQDRGPHRQDAEDVDHRIGEEDRKHQEYPVDGAAGADEDDIGAGKHVAYKAHHTAEGAGEQVEEQELLAPDPLLDHRTEDVEAEHVEEDVGEAAVDEHVGHKLPEPLPQHQRRNHGKVDGCPWIDELGDQIEDGVDHHDHKSKVFICIVFESTIDDGGASHTPYSSETPCQSSIVQKLHAFSLLCKPCTTKSRKCTEYRSKQPFFRHGTVIALI